MSKKVLLTGAAGFIGTHLLDRILTDTDWNVVCLDRLDHAGTLERIANLPSFSRERRRVEIVFHDLRAEITNGVFRTLLTGRGKFGVEPFDHVIHLAAGSHVDRSVSDPAGFVRDNVLGTAHLLDFARENARHFLYFSTDEVAGPAPEGVSFQEDCRMNPLNPYAASKAGGELLCPAYANTYGMRITITRCANVFGEGQDPEKFLPLVVRKILRGEKVQIHARRMYFPLLDDVRKISSSRLYTHHRNVTSALLKILERGECLDPEDVATGRFNIEGGEEVSNLEAAKKIAALLGYFDLNYELVEDPPGRPRPDMRYAIDSTKLRSIGWEPEVSFEDGLRRFVESEAKKVRNEMSDRHRPDPILCSMVPTEERMRFDSLEEDG